MLHVLKKKVSLLWGTFLQLIWDPYYHDKLIHYLFEYSKCKSCHFQKHTYPAGNYRLKVNNRNTRTRCEICSKLTIKYQNDTFNFELVNDSLVLSPKILPYNNFSLSCISTNSSR